jgi:hypothetical protein
MLVGSASLLEIFWVMLFSLVGPMIGDANLVETDRMFSFLNRNLAGSFYLLRPYVFGIKLSRNSQCTKNYFSKSFFSSWLVFEKVKRSPFVIAAQMRQHMCWARQV